jgi:hypothetical protein
MYSVYHQVNPVGVIFSLVLSYYQFTQLATFAKGNALHIALLFLSYFTRRLIIRKPTPRHTPERLSEPIHILTVSLVEPESLLVLPLSYRRYLILNLVLPLRL